MNDSTFPYKGERGRKFGIQSGGTFRTDTIFRKYPDVMIVFNWDSSDTSLPHRSNHFQNYSLNKGKRWEILENAKTTGDAILIEQFYRSYTRKVLVNGVDRTSFETPEPPESKVESSWKTVSRVSRKKQKSRNNQYQKLKTEELIDGQSVVNIEYSNRDRKCRHRELGIGRCSEPLQRVSGREKRNQLKRNMINMFKF